MEIVKVFNKTGYDPFIDFIKAYAIICVLIGHTLSFHDYWGYGLWAGMQVPLFVLVQSFHFFKKEKPSFSFKKIFWRVLVPYFLIQSLVLINILGHYDGDTLLSQLELYIFSGGYGPGSYYPWVYLQLALLLPIINGLVKKGSKMKLAIAFIIICESFEMISSIIDLPDYIHRLLAVRYLFLFYLAWLWVTEGIVINRRTIILSSISFLSIIYFEYFSVDDEILFYKTAWKYHRWPCYYFVAEGGAFLLYYVYKYLSKNVMIDRIIKLLAKCSYEIFLIQMLVLYLYPNGLVKTIIIDLGVVSNIIVDLLLLIVKITIVFTTSIIAGYYFNIFYNRLVKY